jgi:hypothetical protein
VRRTSRTRLIREDGIASMHLVLYQECPLRTSTAKSQTPARSEGNHAAVFRLYSHVVLDGLLRMIPQCLLWPIRRRPTASR